MTRSTYIHTTSHPFSLKRKWKKVLASWPGVHNSIISERSLEGFLHPWESIWKSFSTPLEIRKLVGCTEVPWWREGSFLRLGGWWQDLAQRAGIPSAERWQHGRSFPAPHWCVWGWTESRRQQINQASVLWVLCKCSYLTRPMLRQVWHMDRLEDFSGFYKLPQSQVLKWNSGLQYMAKRYIFTTD